MLRWRLMSGGCEAGIAFAAASTARYRESLVGSGEIEETLAGFLVVNYRAHRNVHIQRCAVRAGSVAAFAMAAPLGLVLRVKAKLK